MSRVIARRILFGFLLLVVAGIYFYDLSRQYLSMEEVTDVREALEVSRSARGLGGDFLPLYFADASNEVGHFPMSIYLEASLLKLAPFSEALVRTPSVVAGVIDVVLMFLVARRVFRRDSLACVAAGMLALTPAHFFHSRLASPQIYLVPFVLAWLLCLVVFLDTGRSILLFAGGAALGIGMYAYAGAFIIVPVYLLTTVVVAWLRHRGDRRTEGDRHDYALQKDLVVATLGFGLAMAPFVVWHALHPVRLRQLAEYYLQHGYNRDLDLTNVQALVVSRLDAWWNGFNPNPVLFFGDASLRFSTKQIGYFLVPTAAFVAAGLVHQRRLLRSDIAALCSIGLAVGPLPAVAVHELEIKRCLTMLPFVALIAACGVAFGLDARRQSWRLAAVALMVLGLIQFGRFLSDYHGDYQGRSSYYFGGNLRGAIREVLATGRPEDCVFLDARATFGEAHWALYSRAYRPEMAVPSPELVDSRETGWLLPARCREAKFIVWEDEENRALRETLERQNWKKTAIPEPDGKVFLAVYRRSAG